MMHQALFPFPCSDQMVDVIVGQVGKLPTRPRSGTGRTCPTVASTKSTTRHRQGAVLLLALVLLVLASTVSLTILQALMTQARMVARADRVLQARSLADAGESRARRLRELDANYVGDLWQVETGQRAILDDANASTPHDMATPDLLPRQMPVSGQVLISVDEANQQLEITADYPVETARRSRIRRIRPIGVSAAKVP